MKNNFVDSRERLVEFIADHRSHAECCEFLGVKACRAVLNVLVDAGVAARMTLPYPSNSRYSSETVVVYVATGVAVHDALTDARSAQSMYARSYKSKNKGRSRVGGGSTISNAIRDYGDGFDDDPDVGEVLSVIGIN